MLLNRHATNECRNFNLIAVRDGYDCFNHVFYLDCELSCRAQDETTDALDLLVAFLERADAEVENWNAEAECLALASSRCDNHVDVRL